MFFKSKINVDNVLVCIGKESNEYEIKIPYINDLVLYFVVEEKNVFRMLTEKDIKKINMSIMELKDKALENVKNKIFKIYKKIPVLRNDNDDIIIPYDADQIIELGCYNFWTSLVLIPEFWNSNNDLCFEKKWKNYYVAMPCRNYLIIGNGENEKSKLEINKLLKEFELDKISEIECGNFEMKREISNEIFIINDSVLKKDK